MSEQQIFNCVESIFKVYIYSVRPIVPHYNSPTTHLSRILLEVFRQIDFKPTFSVENSLNFTDRIMNTNMEGRIMVSFDIVNLYTNIPVDETMALVERLFLEHFDDTTIIDHLLITLRHVVKQNYCQFNNKFYKIYDGLAMGMPLSGFLAD